MSKLGIAYDLEIAENLRLTKAIEKAGVDIGHRCGGNAKCLTCRVEFLEGEPEGMSRAEYDKLKEKNLLGKYRLSCQIIFNDDMKLVPQMTLQNMPAWTDTGPEIADEISPNPDWLEKSELEEFRN